METKQKFNVFCPSIIKSFDERYNSDDLILEGVATTTGVDLEGDYMTRECIKSLKEQITSLNVHMSHKKETKDIVGSVLDVIETDDDTLKIVFVVLPSYSQFIEELLDYGVNLGLSIRGKATDYVKTDSGLKVNQIKLLEVSLTPLPANWDTYGSVKKAEMQIESNCFNGACMQIVKDMSTEENQIEDKNDSEDISLGEQKVIDLINEAISNFEDRIINYFENEYRINDLKQLLQNASATVDEDLSDEKSDEDSKEEILDKPVDEVSEEDEEVDEKETEKSLEDVLSTENEEKTTMTEDIEKTENLEQKIEEPVVEENIEKEIEIDIETIVDKEEIAKSISEDIANNEDLIKSISEQVIEKVSEELSAKLSENVTENILKDLSSNREPVSVEIPHIDLEKEESSVEPMNRYDIARKLARKE